MDAAELLFPRRCAGCGEAGEVLCARCRRVLGQVPQRVATTVDAHVPVFALGPYADAHRGVVLAAKERGNLAVRRLVGAVIGAGVRHLQATGDLTHDVVLVPAPTRARSARLRGGDPVTDFCRAAGPPVATVLRLSSAAGDQTGFGAAGRRANMSGRVELTGAAPAAPIVLVDDVVTTGATLAASVERLVVAGARVQGALVVAVA